MVFVQQIDAVDTLMVTIVTSALTYNWTQGGSNGDAGSGAASPTVVGTS